MKALVLMNMGGATSRDELAMFLRNMFNDKNIITIKSDFFRSIIASFIVMSRLNSAWQNYEAIGGKSPINDITSSLVEKLQKSIPDMLVTWVMRYTNPMSAEVVAHLKKYDVTEVILLPLYPQYSTTTTKSSLEDFSEFAKNDFKLQILDPFYENSMYNQIIIELIKEAFGSDKESEFNLIFSAHGLPQKIIDNGDPYQKQVEQHTKILSDMLLSEGLNFKSINLAYQSKVGPMKWIEPSLGDKLHEFANQKVIIFPIAFTIDNSETVFELSVEYKEEADEIGISDYRVCKCPNDSDSFVSFIKGLTNEYRVN